MSLDYEPPNDNFNKLPKLLIKTLDFLPDTPDGSPKVEPSSGVLYHLRYTLVNNEDAKANAIKIAKAYVDYWKPTNYLFGYEISEKGQPHVHATINHKQQFPSSTMGDFFKKYKPVLFAEKTCPGYRHEKIRKSKLANDKYTIKDDALILTNYSDSEIEEIKDLIEKVKESQKMCAYDKICKIYENLNRDLQDIYDIRYFICFDVYIDTWQCGLPNNNVIKEYSIRLARDYGILRYDELKGLC